MLSEEQNNNKNIKTTLSILISIMFIELILAGLLFINYKKNQTMLNSNRNLIANKIQLISEIEREAIYKKEESLNEKKDTNPRTRPLPQSNLDLKIEESTEIPDDPRTRPLPH